MARTHHRAGMNASPAYAGSPSEWAVMRSQRDNTTLECPEWVRLRHARLQQGCLLYWRKRTLESMLATSEKCHQLKSPRWCGDTMDPLDSTRSVELRSSAVTIGNQPAISSSTAIPTGRVCLPSQNGARWDRLAANESFRRL